MSNETIASSDSVECLQMNANKRIADNWELCLSHSLADNDLIIENIFKWLEPSQLIKCSEVCIKWKFFAKLIGYKRKYFSHQLIYFCLVSTERLLLFKDKYLNIFKTSLEELIDSYNRFVSQNTFNEFKLIIVFSKLDYNQMQDFLLKQFIPNDCTIIHINCRNEIIGNQIPDQKCLATNQYIESEADFDLLSGISALFMSGPVPGIQVNVHKDSKILDIQFDVNLKCILVFHIWRSLYGHFSRLKTDSEYIEHLEQLVNNNRDNDFGIAFGGVTVDRLVVSQTTDSDKLDQYLDYICCLTISGSNVEAFSFVIDFKESNIENNLKAISDKLNLTSNPRIETIGLVFDENAKQSALKLKSLFKNSIKLIGCSGYTSLAYPNNDLGLASVDDLTPD